uniref:hypothetical protein n=1 Tax=Prevotella sp. TaxID=59823 RepID=UPI003FF0ECA1
ANIAMEKAAMPFPVILFKYEIILSFLLDFLLLPICRNCLLLSKSLMAAACMFRKRIGPCFFFYCLPVCSSVPWWQS